MTGKTNTARLQRLGLGAAATVGLLALLPMSSFAAPIGSVADIGTPSAVTRVVYQCWYADGGPHCANLNVPAEPRGYGYYRHHYHHYQPYDGYYYYQGHYRRYRPVKRPEHYWAGSRRWWKSMDYWGRSGNQN
jgi:hypothetical protein